MFFLSRKATIIILVLVIFITLSVYMSNKSKESSALEEEEKAIWMESMRLVANFKLNASYNMQETPMEIEMTYSPSTKEVLDRWKEISTIYPGFSYPSEEIANEDWTSVGNIWGESLDDYVVRQENGSNEHTEDVETINNYVLTGRVYERSEEGELERKLDQLN
ncbi:hypothetical protein HXA35_01885 [Bacillus sp. A301a_S52]|nr:hypothetical protein [Bacillus sp. A301a_S52]